MTLRTHQARLGGEVFRMTDTAAARFQPMPGRQRAGPSWGGLEGGRMNISGHHVKESGRWSLVGEGVGPQGPRLVLPKGGRYRPKRMGRSGEVDSWGRMCIYSPCHWRFRSATVTQMPSSPTLQSRCHSTADVEHQDLSSVELPFPDGELTCGAGALAKGQRLTTALMRRLYSETCNC